MVATTGRIQSGTFVGPELEHYIVTAGGPNFNTVASAEAFFNIITDVFLGSPITAQIVLIGELKTTGHATNGQKFALAAGSGWTAASLSTSLGCTIADNPY